MEHTDKIVEVNKNLQTNLIDKLSELSSTTDNCGKKAISDATKVLSLIEKFSKKHDLALSCGGEWLYQSDRGQVDALELVSNILDTLWEYDESEN